MKFNNELDGINSMLDTAEKFIFEIKDLSIKTCQNKAQRWKRFSNWRNHQWSVNNIKLYITYMQSETQKWVEQNDNRETKRNYVLNFPKFDKSISQIKKINKIQTNSTKWNQTNAQHNKIAENQGLFKKTS